MLDNVSHSGGAVPLDRSTAAARLASFPQVAANLPELRQAAVAVCVTEHDGMPSLLLTRRAARLRAHAGQWALPGRRRDAGETAAEGALRELAEEVGLSLGAEAVLGLLDDYVDPLGYVIAVVCWAGQVGELKGAEARSRPCTGPAGRPQHRAAVYLDPSPTRR